MPQRLLILLFTLLLATLEVKAQNSTANQNSLLPEINPQDIEIRSSFRARFPGLRRQPILGFNPKPRIFRIDENRIPFMETRDEAIASIVISQLDRPIPPQQNSINTPNRKNILANVGFGSFFTPEFKGFFYRDISNTSNLSGNLRFSRSDGHLDDQLGSYRFLDSYVAYSSKIGRQTNIKASIGALFDRNRLFALAPIYQDVIGSLSKKSYSGFNATISLNKTKHALKGFTTDLNFTNYQSNLKAGTSGQGELNKEYYISGSALTYWPGNNLYEVFTVSGKVKIGQYQNSTKNSNDLLQLGLKATYKKLFNGNIHFNATAGVEYISDNISNGIYFTPEVIFSYDLAKNLSFKGGISRTLDMRSLHDHDQTNRFLNSNSILRYSYTSKVFVQSSIKIFSGNIFYSGLSLSNTENQAYYDRVTETRIGQEYALFYQINYNNASEFKIYGGITQHFDKDKFWLDIRAYARKPKLDKGGDIPYQERFGISANINYKPIQKFQLSGWLDVIGKRQAPSVNEILDAYTLISADIEYNLTSKFSTYIKVLNILGEKYELWDGYQERPFQIIGGLIFKF